MNTYNIVLNSSNVIGNYKTQFQYNFINGSFKIGEIAEICVSQVTIPYCWFNINAAVYNNASSRY